MKPKLKSIAFDIRGTLVNTRDPDHALAMRLLLKRLKDRGHTIIIWTGQDTEFAKAEIKKLSLENYIDQYRVKGERDKDGKLFQPDIVFDDDGSADFLGKETTIVV